MKRKINQKYEMADALNILLHSKEKFFVKIMRFLRKLFNNALKSMQLEKRLLHLLYFYLTCEILIAYF